MKLATIHWKMSFFKISFTIKELREMTKLPGCLAVFSPEDFQPIQEIISGKSLAIFPLYPVFYCSYSHVSVAR